MTAVVSVALKRRVTIIAGQAPPGDFVYSHEDQVAGTPFIQGNAEFGVDCPRPRLVALCPPKVAPAGSILLSVRAPVGALNTADGPIGIGRGVAALVARPPTSSRYLWWLLHALRDELSARAAGSTYPAVDARAIASLPFPVLSPQAQADVAGFLDREDKRVHDVHTVLRAQVEALDGYRKGVARDAVQRLRRRPLKYGFLVIDCKHRTPRYILEGFPVISTREVKRGALALETVDRFVDGNDYRDLREGGRDPRPGDIIYSRNASVGVAAYVDGPVEVCLGQDVVLLTRRPRDSALLAHVLNFAVEEQVKRLSVGSTFTRINVPVIRSLVVPDDDPPAELAALRKIEASFLPLAKAEHAMRAMMVTLRDYRDALVTEAVTGKLDVTKVSEQQLDESAHAAMEGEHPEVLSA